MIVSRQKPGLTISYNVPQFKLASTAMNNQWRQIFYDKDILSYVSSQEIEWNFTTALAPWQGGGFKRDLWAW